jgi:hypothetical protein
MFEVEATFDAGVAYPTERAKEAILAYRPPLPNRFELA